MGPIRSSIGNGPISSRSNLPMGSQIGGRSQLGQTKIAFENARSDIKNQAVTPEEFSKKHF